MEENNHTTLSVAVNFGEADEADAYLNANAATPKQFVNDLVS